RTRWATRSLSPRAGWAGWSTTSPRRAMPRHGRWALAHLPEISLHVVSSTGSEFSMDMQKLGHFIGGEWTGADDALTSVNPSDTSDIVARFPNGGVAEVDRAVAAASEAFSGWANASPEVRADLLDKVAALIFARSAELGELLSREEGKTRAEGQGEVLRAARIFRYFGGEALR